MPRFELMRILEQGQGRNRPVHPGSAQYPFGSEGGDHPCAKLGGRHVESSLRGAEAHSIEVVGMGAVVRHLGRDDAGYLFQPGAQTLA